MSKNKSKYAIKIMFGNFGIDYWHSNFSNFKNIDGNVFANLNKKLNDPVYDGDAFKNIKIPVSSDEYLKKKFKNKNIYGDSNKPKNVGTYNKNRKVELGKVRNMQCSDSQSSSFMSPNDTYLEPSWEMLGKNSIFYTKTGNYEKEYNSPREGNLTKCDITLRRNNKKDRKLRNVNVRGNYIQNSRANTGLNYSCNFDNKMFLSFNDQLYTFINEVFKNFTIVGTELCAASINKFVNREIHLQEYKFPPFHLITDKRSKKLKAMIGPSNFDKIKLSLTYDNVFDKIFKGKIVGDEVIFGKNKLKITKEGNNTIISSDNNLYNIPEYYFGNIQAMYLKPSFMESLEEPLPLLSDILIVNIHQQFENATDVKALIHNIVNLKDSDILFCGDFNVNRKGDLKLSRNNRFPKGEAYIINELTKNGFKYFDLSPIFKMKKACRKRAYGNMQTIPTHMKLFYRLKNYNLELNYGTYKMCDLYLNISSHVLIPIILRPINIPIKITSSKITHINMNDSLEDIKKKLLPPTEQTSNITIVNQKGEVINSIKDISSNDLLSIESKDTESLPVLQDIIPTKTIEQNTNLTQDTINKIPQLGGNLNNQYENNNLYKHKYLKYKNKYLNSKNKL